MFVCTVQVHHDPCSKVRYLRQGTLVCVTYRFPNALDGPMSFLYPLLRSLFTRPFFSFHHSSLACKRRIQTGTKKTSALYWPLRSLGTQCCILYCTEYTVSTVPYCWLNRPLHGGFFKMGGGRGQLRREPSLASSKLSIGFSSMQCQNLDIWIAKSKIQNNTHSLIRDAARDAYGTLVA